MRLSWLFACVVAFWFWCSVAQAASTQLVMWHSYRAEEKRALEQIVQAYNKSQKKIFVKLLAIPYDAYADKISAAIPRGHGPDLFIFAHDRIGDWAKNGILEPITFWVDQKLLQRFFPKTVQILAYNNALYGLPLAFKSLALFYNKALVKQPPKTTKELLALAKKLTNMGKNRFGLAYEATNFYHHAMWLHGFGGAVFAGNKLAIASPAAIKALEFARGLKHSHKLLPAEPTSHLISSLFNKGQLAMVFNGPWFRGEINANIKYGVMPLPMVSSTKKPAAPFLTSEAILLNKRSKHKRKAFEVMKYITSHKAAMIRMTVGKQPVANVTCFQTPQAKKDAVLQAFLKQMKQAIPMPNTPEMRMVWTPMLNALGKAFRTKLNKTPQAQSKAFLQEAQREVQSYIKSKKGS